MKLPREKRRHIEEVDEVVGFLSQSNISAKNVERLKVLSESTDEEVACLARVVAEVARIHPHKRRRIKVVARAHRDLMVRLQELGLWEVMRPY